MRCLNDRDLAFGVKGFGVEPGEVVEWVVHQCHVGVPVAEQPCLLDNFAEENLDRCPAGFLDSRVEEPSQQIVRRACFRRQYQRPLRMAGSPGPTRSGFDSIEGCLGLVEQHLACFGKRRAAVVSVEEFTPRAGGLGSVRSLRHSPVATRQDHPATPNSATDGSFPSQSHSASDPHDGVPANPHLAVVLLHVDAAAALQAGALRRGVEGRRPPAADQPLPDRRVQTPGDRVFSATGPAS